MPKARPAPVARTEKRLCGAEYSRTFTPDELTQQVVELGQIAQTIKGGRLDKIMAPQGQPLDLGRLLQLLNQHGAEFLIVGGYAVAFHGHPRFTRDLDLFYRQTPSNAERVLRAFRDYGLDQLTLTIEDLLHPALNYKIGYPPNQLDLNPDVKGLTWDQAAASAVQGRLLGQPVKFLSFDALIDSKTAAGRPQDLADIEHLMRAAGEL
jgi:predicted nucleotidyltransferase